MTSFGTSSWDMIPVGEVLSFVGGSQPPASTFKAEAEEGYVRLVQIRDFYTSSHLTYVPDSNLLRKCAKTDVMIARYGASVGRVLRGLDGAYNVALVKATPKEGIDNDFLFYLLTSDFFQLPLLAQSARSAQAGFSRESIGYINLPCPPLNVQKSIGEILGALDDKIESNRHQQSILLNICHAVFDSAITRGVELMKVDEIVRFRNNERKPLSAMQRAGMERRFPYYGATGIFDYVDGYLFDDVNVLIGEDGSVVNDDGTPVTQMAWGKYWVNNHAHVLSGKAVSTELAYIALARSDVRPLITGAVQLKINMGNLKSLEITMPSVEVRGDVDRQVQENLALWRSKSDESKRLADLRDVLLPELLSGRLRVKDASSMVESV